MNVGAPEVFKVVSTPSGIRRVTVKRHAHHVICKLCRTLEYVGWFIGLWCLTPLFCTIEQIKYA